MSTFSSITGAPLPELSDVLSAEKAFGEYALAMDSIIVPQYTTTALRDSAMSSGKTEGQVCAVTGELQIWDGSDWWNMHDIRYITKAADTTRISTTTQTADPHLQVPVKAGGTYIINAWLSPVCTSTSVNFAAAWSTTGPATFLQRTIFGPRSDQTNVNSAQMNTASSGASTVIATGTLNATVGSLRLEQCLVRVSSAGDDTVVLTWAQSVLTATNLTLQQKSFIEYRRIH